LNAGTYWLVVAPHGDVNAATGSTSEFWLWFFSNDINLSDAQFIDPDNFYGAGLTSWNPISATPWGNSSTKALAFTIVGDNQAAVAGVNLLEQVLLYPNPVLDKLHIDMPSSVGLESAVIYDLLGKQFKMDFGENNVLDMSKMTSGVYILELETTAGKLTKKVIKK
jgi:hypothetical protein